MEIENTVADKQRENSDAEDGTDRRLRNLRPWPKGVSGNPKGRPKSQTLGEAYRKALAEPVPNDPEGRTFAEVIAAMVCESAISGNINAAREIADRTEVKNQRFPEHSVTQEVDIVELKREKLTLATQNFLDAGMGNVSDAFAYFELRGVSKEDLALVRGEDLVIPATREIDSEAGPQARR